MVFKLKQKHAPQYTLAPAGQLLFWGIYLVIAVIFLTQKKMALRISALAPIYPHFSNFMISYFLLGIMGYSGLQHSKLMQPYVIAAMILIVINITVECAITLLNTPDKMDAVYGIVGTLLALMVLFILRRFFLVKIKSE